MQLDAVAGRSDHRVRPLNVDSGSPRRINVSLDFGLLRAIDEELKRRGMTRSAFLSSAARNEIEGR